MTALPDTAAAAAATADPDRALQVLNEKRIALSAKLTSLLDSSVLHFCRNSNKFQNTKNVYELNFLLKF